MDNYIPIKSKVIKEAYDKNINPYNGLVYYSGDLIITPNDVRDFFIDYKIEGENDE